MPPSAYKQIDLYIIAKKLVQACYEMAQEMPEEERSLSGQKLRLAVLTAYISIIKVLTQKPKKKLFENAITELFVVDSLLEIYGALAFVSPEKETEVGQLLDQCFQLLKKLKSKPNRT